MRNPQISIGKNLGPCSSLGATGLGFSDLFDKTDMAVPKNDETFGKALQICK